MSLRPKPLGNGSHLHPDKDELFYGPVSRELNNVRNEGPELLESYGF